MKKRRFVRPGDELDDSELVLRGGVFDPAILRADARRMFDVYGTYGISVFALRSATVDELAQRMPLVRFSRLTILAVGTIRAGGLAVEATGRNPRHYTLVLPDLAEGVAVLTTCERQVWLNPYHDP